MSTDASIAIVDTGVANIASLLAAFRRLGLGPTLTGSAEAVDGSDFVVLPGVGAFGAGMRMLRDSALVEPLRERIGQGRPTLAVCLGMQLLASRSAETPGVEGLGIVDIDVERFSEAVRVPQFGWNRVVAGGACELLEDGYAYFANSYRIGGAPDDWACASAEYDGPFVAAMERGAVLACQFHPEISGEWGLGLLERWLAKGGA